MAKKKEAGDLVIVESPAKAKTIEKYLGEGYTVLSSYGHVRDLPERDLSVDVDNGFDAQQDGFRRRAGRGNDERAREPLCQPGH